MSVDNKISFKQKLSPRRAEVGKSTNIIGNVKLEQELEMADADRKHSAIGFNNATTHSQIILNTTARADKTTLTSHQDKCELMQPLLMNPLDTDENQADE